MPAFFDGIANNILMGNPFDLNGRHNKGKLTNICFFDGHAATYSRKDLPTGEYTTPQTTAAIGANMGLEFVNSTRPSPIKTWLMRIPRR